MNNKKMIKLSAVILGIVAICTVGWYSIQEPNVKAQHAQPTYSTIDVSQKKAIKPAEDVVNVEAMYLWLPNVDELAQNADLILIGSPTEEFQDREHFTEDFPDGTLKDFYTKTNFHIESIIKKPEDLSIKEGEDFKVAEPIGYEDTVKKETKVTLSGYTELEKGKKYIVFFEKNKFGDYIVVNLNLGKFQLGETADGAFLSRSSNTEPAVVTGESSLTLQDEYNEFFEAVKKKYDLSEY